MKKLNEEGLELVDGKVVSIYETRFTGSFILEPEDAASISSGDVVSFIVRGVAGPPKFAQDKKTGQYKRVNSFKIDELTALSPDRAKQVYDSLDIPVEGVNEGIVETKYVVPEEQLDLGMQESIV